MDKRLTTKLTNYVRKFKDDIKNELVKLECIQQEKLSEFLNYLYEYEQIEINRTDFLKRKRVKNTIPNNNRCNALKAGGNQCTRRRKENCLYCGTHIKGAPHGEASEINSGDDTKTLDITAHQIHGIIYYIDNIKNIYKMEDVISGIENPNIIGSYRKVNNELFVSIN